MVEWRVARGLRSAAGQSGGQQPCVRQDLAPWRPPNAPDYPPESVIVGGLKLNMYGGKGTITALVFWSRTCKAFLEHG